MRPDSFTTYRSAVETFVRQVGALPPERLAGPGLGRWDLRALVGHTSRSLVTVDTYLDQPAERVEIATAAEYYVAAMSAATDPEAVAARGRQAGVALGADPAWFVRDLADRVLARLEQHAPDYVLSTIAGAMRLEEYLRTRTFELVVHGLDTTRATGVEATYDDTVLLDATTLAAELAVVRGQASAVLLALTGRDVLPPGFSLL